MSISVLQKQRQHNLPSPYPVLGIVLSSLNALSYFIKLVRR